MVLPMGGANLSTPDARYSPNDLPGPSQAIKSWVTTYIPPILVKTFNIQLNFPLTHKYFSFYGLTILGL